MSLLERIRGGKKFRATATAHRAPLTLPPIVRATELDGRSLKFHQSGPMLLFDEMPGTVIDEIDEYRGAGVTT
jgi:hypothetical protein